MIRINLAKKQSKGGGGIDLKNFNIKDFLQKLRTGDEEGKRFDFNNPIVRVVVAAGVCWYVGSYLDDAKTEELHKMDLKIQEVEKQKNEVASKLAKIKGWEPIKKQLEDDEKSIRNKLDVVKRLLEDRDAPAKMLMQVAQAIPDEVWLTNLNVTEDAVKLTGQTPGYNQVSDFIKALNGTSQFSDIALNGISEESTSANKEQVIQSFDLNAKRRKGP